MKSASSTETAKLVRELREAYLGCDTRFCSHGPLLTRAAAALDGIPGPKTPQVPTDEMKKAGASVRVNLHFHNQGISGFLSEYEAGEIYERMEEKRT